MEESEAGTSGRSRRLAAIINGIVRVSHIRGKSSPGGGANKYKGPGVGPHLPCPRNRSRYWKNNLKASMVVAVQVETGRSHGAL